MRQRPFDEAGIRLRLEGHIELVERTREPYRELADVLRSPWWRARLQKRAALMSQLVSAHGDVETALDAMHRHSLREPWPPSLLELLSETMRLRDEVAVLSAKRVRDGTLAPKQRLEHLLERVLSAKRFIVPGWELRAATEVLPWPSAELEAVAAFTAVLTSSLHELVQHEAAWHGGYASLKLVLERLRGVDPTQRVFNAVHREALRLSSREDVSRYLNGLDVVLGALSSLGQFELAADAFLKPRLGLVPYQPDERFALLRWLQAPELPLTGLTESRAALFRLGHALSALPKDRTLWPWEQLTHLATRADTVAHTSPGWAQLRDLLEVLAKALQPQGSGRSFETLTEAVQALRAS